MHGYGWFLLSPSRTPVLSAESTAFFVDTLGGKIVSVSLEEDVEGGYAAWFDGLGSDQVVLVRPDFYVFGHAAMPEVDALVGELQAKLGSVTPC